MKVVTFGELLLRLNPQFNKTIFQADSFDISYAGSEANVAVSLSNFALNSILISALPNNELGVAAISKLKMHGIDTSKIVIKEGRIGVYFVEMGFSQRASKVIYDRSNSVFSNVRIDDFDWNQIFRDTDWFHFSGITPALSEEMPYICEKALIEAKKRGLKISFDINFRSKLWPKEQASLIMLRYMKYIDVLIGNEEDVKVVFGLNYSDYDTYSIDTIQYSNLLKSISDTYNLKKIYLTLRESISATRNIWSSIAISEGKIVRSRKYEIDIIDRLGAGDSFSAGVIYGELMNYDTSKVLDFATAASCLKHTIHQDFNLVSIEEIMELMNSNGSGRIQR